MADEPLVTNDTVGGDFNPDSVERSVLCELADRSGVKYVDSTSPAELVELVRRSGPVRYDGLSLDALKTLARLRELGLTGGEDTRQLIRMLKKAEGFRGRLRKRARRWVASALSSMLGEHHDIDIDKDSAAARRASLKDDIERRGVAPALADRLKGSADEYISVKLDEIEQRIDRKLDEIDNRLAQWRDREIENRLRIIRITLTASVMVAIISVAYAWLKKHFGW